MRRVLPGVVLLLAACGVHTPTPQVEPEHKVDFSVTGVGSANEDVKISWSAGSHASGSTTVAGSMPFWAKSVTSDKGAEVVLLTAQGWSTDGRFSLDCRITIDGVEVVRRQGSSCAAEFYLKNLASALANRPSPSPSPSLSPASVGPPPAGCRFLTYNQVATVVQGLSHVDKPVQVARGSENSCSYVIDYQTATVGVRWEPGAKAQLTGATAQVPGLPDPAYWLDLGTVGNLQVQRNNGLFTVTAEPGALAVDRKQLAIDIYLAARPKLP